MTALTGLKPSATYKDLLQVSNSNSGIDATLRAISDGEGTAALLQLSSAATAISSGNLYIGDSANANMTLGLTINQGANDDQIFALKSSDISTGLTSAPTAAVEVDDFLTISKQSATLGGVRIQVMAEDDAIAQPLTFNVWGGTAGTAKTTAAAGLVHFQVWEHDGANGAANITADGNVFAIMARVGGANVTRFLVDEDGDMYSVTAGQTFDSEDDAALLRAYQLWQADEHPGIDTGIKPSRFDGNAYSRGYMMSRLKMQEITEDEWNAGARALTNTAALGRLQTGAIWQMHEMLDALFDSLDPATRAKVRQEFIKRDLPLAILDWRGP